MNRRQVGKGEWLMAAWIVLLVLITAEAGGLTWWLKKEYYPFIFSGWAPLLYATVLALDFIAAWLVSHLIVPGGTGGTALLAVLGILMVIVVALFTLFFRWVVRLEMTDIS